MPAFNGVLRQNEVFGALYNMIISQQVFADNIAGTNDTLANMSRVDGSLYGDTKLYYSTDALETVDWRGDAEAGNLLATHRPEAPKVQAVVVDQFRMIPVTVDHYLSKRAFSTENAFSEFNSVILGWIRDTKKIYDATLFNAYVGTAQTEIGRQLIEVPMTEGENEANAMQVAVQVADLIVDLQDPGRDFNDYSHMRSYNPDDLVFVWNSKYVNQIKKLAMPIIYNSVGLVDKLAEHTLPERYFGTVNAAGGTTGSANTTVRSLIEKTYGDVHCFPGDLLPGNATYLANETYNEDANVICKVMHKKSVPFLTAFETGTVFTNQRALLETHYLIWGHNTLEYLKNYPMITLKKTEA